MSSKFAAAYSTIIDGEKRGNHRKLLMPCLGKHCTEERNYNARIIRTVSQCWADLPAIVLAKAWNLPSTHACFAIVVALLLTAPRQELTKTLPSIFNKFSSLLEENLLYDGKKADEAGSRPALRRSWKALICRKVFVSFTNPAKTSFSREMEQENVAVRDNLSKLLGRSSGEVNNY